MNVIGEDVNKCYSLFLENNLPESIVGSDEITQ